MKINLINIIHILIIWQSILFAGILITPKYKAKRSNKFLALMLFTLGVHFIYNILFTNGYYLDSLPQYSCCYGYLYGPFLYLYIKFHLQKDINFKLIYWLHFLPFITIIIVTSVGYSLCGYIGFWLLPIMIAYSLLGLKEVYVYKKVINQVAAGNYDSETFWIKSIIFNIILVIIINIVQSQIYQIELFGLSIVLEPVVQIGVLILVNMITYQGLKNPQFFQQISTSDIIVSENTKTKNPNQDVKSEELNSIANKLESFMQENSPYLNPDLDLNSLAKELAVHPKTLSQAINNILGNNFSEYINRYRIEKAKSLLLDQSDEKKTIMEVMYDSGFISRSVFNTSFKKITGLTPSQYKSQH